MAWCVPCEQYFTPGTLDSTGSCPNCGADVQHRHRSLGDTSDAASVVIGVSSSGGASSVVGVGSGTTNGTAATAGEASVDSAPDRLPWHFWLLLVSATVYLGWRAIQGVALLLTLPT